MKKYMSIYIYIEVFMYVYIYIYIYIVDLCIHILSLWIQVLSFPGTVGS